MQRIDARKGKGSEDLIKDLKIDGLSLTTTLSLPAHMILSFLCYSYLSEKQGHRKLPYLVRLDEIAYVRVLQPQHYWHPENG